MWSKFRRSDALSPAPPPLTCLEVEPNTLCRLLHERYNAIFEIAIVNCFRFPNQLSLTAGGSGAKRFITVTKVTSKEELKDQQKMQLDAKLVSQLVSLLISKFARQFIR